MHIITRVAFIAALLFAGTSCNINGPSESIAGHWIAQGVGHSSWFGLTLQQNGDEVMGTACHGDPRTIFRDAPVAGDYPSVRVDVTAQSLEPCCPQLAGARFVGRLDSTRDIVGTYQTPSMRVDLRFRRSDASACP